MATPENAPGGGRTGRPFIDGLPEGPANWDVTEWGVVAPVVVSVVLAAVPPCRRAIAGWVRGLLAEPVTFGDYALPNRRIEGRPRAETSRIGHMARAGKRVVLHGGGGRGKSTLACLFVDRRRTQYRGICWIDASGEDGLRKAMVWLAKTLDPALSAKPMRTRSAPGPET